MDRPTCSQLRTKLNDIRFLKGEFDLALSKVKNTRSTALVYILEKDIRDKIKYIKETLFFTHFGHLEWKEVVVGGKTKEGIIKELDQMVKSNKAEEKIQVPDHLKDMINSPEFVILDKPETINLVRLKVSDLGFLEGATTAEIYKRATELCLDLCPPEVGPLIRLNYKEIFHQEQPKDDLVRIGMKPISSFSQELYIFSVLRTENGRRLLNNDWFHAGSVRSPEKEWVFCMRKSKD
jgi:hypothetical protein